jgi:outer membrane lipoprotein SlyB
MSQPNATLEPPESPTDRPEQLDELAEPFLVAGRPVEDRSFEVVEAGVGISLGMAIGTAVAGPIGTAVGGVIGAAAGIVAGEALERAAGRAATTTDAADDESE